MSSLGEKMSDNDIEEMLREADKNKDGLIDYDEFAKTMLSI